MELGQTKNHELLETLKKFWDTESQGIVESKNGVPPNDFLTDVAFNGNQYVVGIPWRKDEICSISNDCELSLNA